MIRNTRRAAIGAILAATAAAILASGAKCNGGGGNSAPLPPSYFGNLTSWATWPHTGKGASASPSPVPDVCVDEPNGRGPAGYAAVAASVRDWNAAAGRTLLTIDPDSTPCGAAKIVVYLSADLEHSAKPGTPTPEPGSRPTLAYTNAQLFGRAPADGQKGGTLAHADIWVYGFDDTGDVRGIMNHELMRALGAVAGTSPNRADVLYATGKHGKPTRSDAATLADIYSR